MRDASWVLSAFLTAGFLIAAAASTHSALAIGWLVLAIGMAVVTWVRYRTAHRPPE